MKKKMNRHLLTSLLAVLLVLSLCISPISRAVVHAEGDTDVVSVDDAEARDTEDVAGEDTPVIVPETPDASEVLESDGSEETTASEEVDEEGLMTASVEDDITDWKLVYGDKDLADKDALVLLIFGDGFTAEQQEKFFEEAEKTANYVMETSPWDEFTDSVKFYAVGTASNESGARADNAQTQEAADADTRDTYFGTTFWSGGMQRLVTVGDEGMKKLDALKAVTVPEADYSVIIVNSTTYGGSGGEVCLASLNSEALEMMLHELGHTIPDLADEYFSAGYEGEYANMTAESDPAKVPWAKFVGKNGVGVYEYDEGGYGWYRPSQNCKMRYLGKQFAFCEVCKEELRKAFSAKSNVTKLFFQPYATEFCEGGETDIKNYFILRKAGNTVEGEALSADLQITYYDASGNELESAPVKKGNYTFKAEFAGNDTFEKCSLSGAYTIEPPYNISIDVATKVYDGEPADVNYTVDLPEGSYDVSIKYTGTMPYTKKVTNEYESEDAPAKPGSYNVEILAYDKSNPTEIVGKGKASFDINYKLTTLVNHDDASTYPGAAVYYNNKTIVITGEGFTADEQDKFEELAQKYMEHIQNTEPFKETQIYFNFSSIEAESDESGIGTEAKDTYFGLTYDENGKIVPAETSYDAAHYLAYYGVLSRYKSAIVIVNDENVKEGTADGRVIYGGTDEDSMDYVTRELLNYMTGHEVGYEASTEEEIAAQHDELMSALYFTWYGDDYAVVVSDAYRHEFVANGSPIELDDYFQTYILGKEVPKSEMEGKYVLTYYDSEGNELDGAPSEPGNYYVLGELIPSPDEVFGISFDYSTMWKVTEDQSYGDGYVWDDTGYLGYVFWDPVQEITMNDVTYHVPRARGYSPYTILAAGSSSEDPGKGDSGNGDSGNAGGSDNGSTGGTTDNNSGSSNTASDVNAKGAAKTGDTAPIALYLILFAGAVVAGGSVIVKRRRR